MLQGAIQQGNCQVLDKMCAQLQADDEEHWEEHKYTYLCKAVEFACLSDQLENKQAHVMIDILFEKAYVREEELPQKGYFLLSFIIRPSQMGSKILVYLSRNARKGYEQMNSFGMA